MMFGHQDEKHGDGHQDGNLPAPVTNDDAAALADAPTLYAGSDDNAAADEPNDDTGVPEHPADSGRHSHDGRGGDELLNLKQQALHELTPLVDHLEQTPEERFRTTMMMIQASDNQALLKTAYDAAKRIEDEKVRAQALLDVVNEINYFTLQPPVEN